MRTIVKMVFGSHLYGTATPSSDHDYMGVFMPKINDIFLNRVPKSYRENTKKSNDAKNTLEDIDVEIYSLHYFIQLACEGQTGAMDMLHAPENMLLKKHPLWDEIIENRHKFYTRNLKAFVGYARKQAAKYGIKGSRLGAAKTVVDLLKQKLPQDRLRDFWDELPLNEHSRMIGRDPNGMRQYQCCGKVVQESATAKYVLEIFEKFYDAYGKRARLAARNEGIDWKAVSHALRAAFQVQQLFMEGTITFPLKQAPLLLQVKQGTLDYSTVVAPLLEEEIARVEDLSTQSNLPMKPDRKFWDKFVFDAIRDFYHVEFGS